MNKHLPRILYIIAAMSWLLLLWPNPVTIFMAACFSCLTLPVYNNLRFRASTWKHKLAKLPKTRWNRFLMSLSHMMPITAYTLFILSTLVVPLSVVVLLVSPQAVAGYARLRELQASNFRLPPNLVEYIQKIRLTISEYPRLEKIINEGLANLDTMFSDAVGILVSRSFGFVGSTMNLFWLIFLFLTLTVLFSAHAGTIRKVTYRIPGISPLLLSRFIKAIHRALKAIVLGIIFVALVQGVLCGIGFYFAGVNQPAFWGMLATIVAPIPMVGTALVWLPLCISLWFGGNTMAAIGLAAWGIFFVAGVDNILRPFFLRQGIKASFFVLILSILCGMNMFGAVGLIAGPVLLAIGLQAYEESNMLYSLRDHSK